MQAAALSHDAEVALYEAVTDSSGAVEQALLERRYTEALTRLTGLSGAVDQFFDQVMVMDENPDVRNNRLALLAKVQALLGGVADLSRLPG